MPYLVKKQGEKWVVYNPETGKVYGTHPTKAQAQQQAALLYAKTGGRTDVKEEP